MRIPFAAALIALGLASVTAAGAADLAGGYPGNYSGGYFFPHGERAGQFLIYDDEPGVSVRPYWLAPWQNRHYFPTTGKRPRIGRREYLSVVRPPPKPAETFQRSWSNERARADELPRRQFAGPRGEHGEKHVIHADAEVTILGPDRMSIRLSRKGQGPKADGQAQ